MGEGTGGLRKGGQVPQAGVMGPTGARAIITACLRNRMCAAHWWSCRTIVGCIGAVASWTAEGWRSDTREVHRGRRCEPSTSPCAPAMQAPSVQLGGAGWLPRSCPPRESKLHAPKADRTASSPIRGNQPTAGVGRPPRCYPRADGRRARQVAPASSPRRRDHALHDLRGVRCDSASLLTDSRGRHPAGSAIDRAGAAGVTAG